MRNQLAFIDEFGNHGFDFNNTGVSTHYIITSVIIDEDKFEESNNKLEIVRKGNFQTGEMKSSSIKDNDGRRIKILNEFKNIPFHIYALVVDKRKLVGEGIKYKASFQKFLHRHLEFQIVKTFPNIKIFIDNHGGEDFKESFIKYIKSRYVPTLFEETDINFLDSKNSLFIQLADIITGTIARCFDQNKLSNDPALLLNPINEKIIEIKEFPKNFAIYEHVVSDKKSKFSKIISELSISLSSDLIEKKSSSRNPLDKDLITTLKYLLFYFRYINPNYYIPTRELIRQIELYKNVSVSIHYFRSKIIAKLRDDGILIASCSKGYKLPGNEFDLIDFMNHNNSIIQPMLARIERCRKQIKLATKNELDLLNIPEYSKLKKFFD